MLKEVADVGFVAFALRIVHSQYFHEVVCRVRPGRALEPYSSEVRCTVLGSALVNGIAVHHENETVEGGEGI